MISEKSINEIVIIEKRKKNAERIGLAFCCKGCVARSLKGQGIVQKIAVLYNEKEVHSKFLPALLRKTCTDILQ